MNVFLDSNILFKDYFFENKSQSKILDYTKRGLINLYMSEIVRLELRRQFLLEIEAKNRELNKVIKDAKRLKISTIVNLIDIPQQLIEFDTFHNDLEKLDNFHIVKYKNEYLPDIVDRAIYRKKPFTEERTELKDALIWKSYSDFVETNNLSDCILLTNNTTDFCDKTDKSKVHKDLLKDSNRFLVVNSAFDFLKEKGTILESPEHKFQKYFSTLSIDENFILNLITINFDRIIDKKVHEYIDNLSPNEIHNSEYWLDGYVIGYDIEILRCRDIEHEILGANALISGIVSVSCETESFQYNAARDAGEEQYSFIDEQNLIFDIYFNFDLHENEVCSEFEIIEMNIVE